MPHVNAESKSRNFNLYRAGGLVLLFFLIIGIFLTMGATDYFMKMPGKSYAGPFLPLSKEETVVRNNLSNHIYTLAGHIGDRNLWKHKELEKAAAYIKEDFEKVGYKATFEEFIARDHAVKNIVAEKKGQSQPDEIILIGAHYDSVKGCPGANDNASGVAALLETARLLRNQDLAKTVRFVAFVNEEPPFFLSDAMGSRVHAKRARRMGEKIIAMFSLETIGYYSDKSGSQNYPFPFSLFYPDMGNFIAFVGNIGSRKLVHQAIASFRRHAHFPSEGVAAPGWMTGIGWSDQWSFWREGFKAVMITDTALFRYRYYHTLADTPDKISYDRMARLVSGIASMAADLAGEVRKPT